MWIYSLALRQAQGEVDAGISLILSLSKDWEIEKKTSSFENLPRIIKDPLWTDRFFRIIINTLTFGRG